MQTTLYTPLGKSLAAIAFFLMCAGSVSGFLSGCNGGAHPKAVVLVQPPLSLSIVPGLGGITMAKNKPDEFYVVITNVSGGPESVWQYWNSWGYQAISFELTTADGKKFVLSKKQEEFTRNFPSTFVVEPGEQQVYPIRLDEWWETHPALPTTGEMPITLKAIYEVTRTPEAAHYKVLTGPTFCTKASERVYITTSSGKDANGGAQGAVGDRRAAICGANAAGAGGL